MPRIGLEPEERDIVLNTVRDLGRDIITPEHTLAWDREGALPREVMQTLLGPDVGLHLLFLPEPCGGAGGGARDLCAVSEALSRLDLGLATTMLGVALGCDPLRVGGTEEQQRRWLGQVADRGLLVAYGVTEPEAGSDVASLRTRAEPVRDGDRVVAYRLDGVKQFITNGSVADLYTVLARAPGGPSFFVVQRGTPGLGAGSAESKHGIRCSDTAQVVLDGVEVPADQLVGLEEGRGLAQANQVFGHTRLMVAAMALGAGRETMGRAVAHAGERTQFGKPLCELRGYVGKLLLPHLLRLEAAGAYIGQTAARLDAGEAGLQTEGAVAKLHATEAASRAADAAVQALGGYGYIREYLVEKIRRDVRVTTIYEGTSEVMQNLIFVFRLRQVVRGKSFYREMAQGYEGPAPELLSRCAETLDQLVLTMHRLKVGRRQDVRFQLADRMVELEHALALGRASVGAGRAMKAGCRVLAARTAASLATTAARLLAASELRDEELALRCRELAVDELLATRHGSPVDVDLAAAWALERAVRAGTAARSSD